MCREYKFDIFYILHISHYSRRDCSHEKSFTRGAAKTCGECDDMLAQPLK